MEMCLVDRSNENKTFTILNYQGSKKNLIDFIHEHVDNLIDPTRAFLDIFSGTCSVGYSYKSNYQIYANDLEYYSYLIADALLKNYSSDDIKNIIEDINSSFNILYKNQLLNYENWIMQELRFIETNDIENLIELYNKYPTIWNNISLDIDPSQYLLFTSYYAGNYFGICQAIEIDCLRKLIDKYDKNLFSMLMSCLFFAMKNCVFAKDGHMAQPLSLSKNKDKLISKRKNSIVQNFFIKLEDFLSSDFVNTTYQNKAYNLDFEDLLNQQEIQDNVGFIYADPPYTDMQYSRYYHLLNTISKYDYQKPTFLKDNYTKGLYTEGRSQSLLSKKSCCLEHFNSLIDFSINYKKNLAISFAYPKDPLNQKTDRYVMSIDDLVGACSQKFKKKNIEIVSTLYNHSNNRNAQSKKVLEYLILCKY